MTPAVSYSERMTLLPVVERELRVAARERNTYRVRFLAAFLAVLFSAFSLWFVRAFFGSSPIPPRDLFLFLTWIAYLFVLFAGFALTCDSISQEKRDSTLGLLFLTDLKGYDVVLGKLTVAGLRGFYALLSTIPVMALPLMMGGTNLSELARVSLTLLVTLAFSMAVGIAVSGFLRRSWSAFGLSAGVLFLFAAVLPIYSEFVRSYYRNPVWAQVIQLPSPTNALIMSFRNAIGLTGNSFALSLSIIAALFCAAILLAVLVTPHVWQDRHPARNLAAVLHSIRELKFGSKEFRAGFRRRLLNLNPIYWLSRRERVSSLGLMLMILAAGIAAGWIASLDWTALGPKAHQIIPFIAWMICGIVVHILILLRLAVVAAERFGDDRRSGALELILSTPMSIKSVLAGHWMGLRRYFIGPVLMAFGIQLLVTFQFFTVEPYPPEHVLTFPQVLSEVYQHLRGNPVEPYVWDVHLFVVVILGLFPILFLDWISLAWLSTWFSLRVKLALTAPVGALVALHLPPWLLLGLIAGILQENRWVPSHDFSEALLFVAIGGLLIVAHQFFCIAWSRRQMYRHFRAAATDRYQPAPKRRWWHWRLV